MNIRERVQDAVENRLIEIALKRDVSINDLFSDYETRLYNLRKTTYHYQTNYTKLMFRAYQGVKRKYEI